jgi:hypothetical protein
MKTGKSIELTYDEVMTNPSYEGLREAAVLLQKSTFAELFPKKHILGLKSMVRRKLKDLHHENILLPLKDVVAHVLETLPDDTSAATVIELTRFTIEKWELMTEREPAEA